MTADQFAYWLQGFAELNAEPPTAEQWASIKEHLQLVFKKVTPAVRQAAPGFLQGIPFQGAQGSCGINVNNPNANLIC